MIELYQSESCAECGVVRRELARLGATYVVRSVPMDRARRERAIEAGGRPDIPLLFDPERGRTTYEAEEIVNQLGADDFFATSDAEADPSLARLYQREGDRESDQARAALDKAGIDYVCHNVKPAAAETVPRLIEPRGGPARMGVEAIFDWVSGFKRR